MGFRHIFLVGTILAASAVAQDKPNQATPPVESSSMPVIRAEARLVLVDAVVTDKKGNYLRDLTQKDFKVWEDGKEKEITSFSLESGSANPNRPEKHYIVLFFDNTTMSTSDQMQARIAAGKFIDANAGKSRLMAIVSYGGTLQVSQNFTTDAERLKRVVSGVKIPSVGINDQTIDIAPTGISGISGAEFDFAARTGLLALRSMAKTLATLPGRKTLVLLTAGFILTPEHMSEVTAVISECNKANVAIYPIDVRGLMAAVRPLTTCDADSWPCLEALPSYEETGDKGDAQVQLAQHSGAPVGGGHGGGTAPPGGGGTGGSGGNRGGTGGNSGGTGGNRGGGNSGGGKGGGGSSGGVSNSAYNNALSPYNRYNQSSLLLPPLLKDVTTNQQVLYMLADGTGGFVIVNTNDLVGGLERINREQDEYYLLGYKPDSDEGMCHVLKVKVDRGGANVRARTGYCNVTPQDQLAGDPIEKELETCANTPAQGSMSASLQLPYFYTSPNRARVNIAMDIPAAEIKTTKVKGKLHADINILGIASDAGGKTAARFSDTVKLDFENKKEFEEFSTQPFHYENQFDIAPGKYNLKVAFESGRNFGKAQAPLSIEGWDGKHFSMSGVAISKEIHRIADMTTGLDAELVADRTPLIAQGAQIEPSGSDKLKKSGIGVLYLEIYEPLLTGAIAPKVGLQMKIMDRKSGEWKFDTGMFAAPNANNDQTKNPIMPVALKIPVDTLAPGSYRAELKAIDSVGRSVSRSTDFEIE